MYRLRHCQKHLPLFLKMAEGFDIQMMITKMQLNFAVVVITLVRRAISNFRLLSNRSKGFRSVFSHSIFYSY